MSKRIAIVEDEQRSAKTTRPRFEREGYNVDLI